MAVYPERRKGRLTGKWLAEALLHGKRQRGRFDTKREADQWEGIVKLTGELPAETAVLDAGPTFGDVAREVQAANQSWDEGRDRSGRDRLAYVVEALGRDTPLAQITTVVLDGLVKRLKSRRGRNGGTMAPATVNRYLSAVSSVFHYARKRKYVEAAPSVPWMEEKGGRIHWLTQEQEAAVCRALETAGEPECSLIVHVLCATGMRWGELEGVGADQIEREWIRLWRTKNNDPRSVPIGPVLSSPLRALKVAGTFPQYSTFRKRFKAAVKSAGLPDEVCIHSLRHTTATRLMQRGVNVQIAQKFLGHRDVKTTLKYTHVADSDLMEASKKISPHAGQIEKTPPQDEPQVLDIAGGSRSA